jgi:hypothetical protein
VSDGSCSTQGVAVRVVRKTLLLIAMAVAGASSHAQNFYYVEPGVPACPAAPTTAAPKAVVRGVAVPGRIQVSCGFDQGSYTVSLNSTDPGAAFSPKTFIVNFGRLVGNGAFAVTFSTPGVHGITIAITSNMGSPVVRGQFVSHANEFNVVNP